MAYGRRRKFRRYGKGKRSFKRRGLKTRYRKMGSSRGKLYRTGGNFAMSLAGAKPELKSYDNVPYNWNPPAGAPWTTAAVLNPILSSKSIRTGASGTTIASVPGSAIMFTANSGNLLTGDDVMLCNGVSPGNDIFNRLGRRLRMRSILVTLQLIGPCTTVDISATDLATTATATRITSCRLLLVLDKQPNGTQCLKNDILASLGSARKDGGYASPESNMNLDNRDRFLILFDKIYTTDTVDRVQRSVRIYKKLNIEVTYNNGQNARDVSALMTNALYLVAVSNQPAPDSTITAPEPGSFLCPFAIFTNTRLRYTDA